MEILIICGRIIEYFCYRLSEQAIFLCLQLPFQGNVCASGNGRERTPVQSKCDGFAGMEQTENSVDSLLVSILCSASSNVYHIALLEWMVLHHLLCLINSMFKILHE